MLCRPSYAIDMMRLREVWNPDASRSRNSSCENTSGGARKPSPLSSTSYTTAVVLAHFGFLRSSMRRGRMVGHSSSIRLSPDGP